MLTFEKHEHAIIDSVKPAHVELDGKKLKESMFNL